jgi:hypothetical protein
MLLEFRPTPLVPAITFGFVYNIEYIQDTALSHSSGATVERPEPRLPVHLPDAQVLTAVGIVQTDRLSQMSA